MQLFGFSCPFNRFLNCILSVILVWWFELNNISITIGEFGFLSVKGVKICWKGDRGLVCILDKFIVLIFSINPFTTSRFAAKVAVMPAVLKMVIFLHKMAGQDFQMKLQAIAKLLRHSPKKLDYQLKMHSQKQMGTFNTFLNPPPPFNVVDCYFENHN